MFDEEITQAMDKVFAATSVVNKKTGKQLTPDQLRIWIAATNLKGLVNVILMSQNSEEIELDLNQLALGLLGTIDWMLQGVPNNDATA